MAIYSCNLRSIGRSTHAAGTAGAHIRYISRPDADPVLLAEHMPYDHVQARAWMDGRERAMRKNARVIDKLRIALPRELTEEQRAELVEAFMADLTSGRVPWFAAIHQRGKDAHNPHVHIAVHDRDNETGRRVLRLSDNARDRLKAGLPGPKAVEWIRERWEIVCNEALENAGHAVRIDRRTLTEQGIERQAGIHEGPRAQHIEGSVKRPASKQRINGCGRVIDYPSIDHGRTRREFNAHIIDLNLERAASSGQREGAIWAQHEREELARDRALDERLAGEERARTAAFRTTSQLYLDRIGSLRAEREAARGAAARAVQARFNPRRERIKERQTEERADLKRRQGSIYARIVRHLDFTGITKRRQQAARKLLAERHKRERKLLSESYREARKMADAGVRGKYRLQITKRQGERLAALADLKLRHAALAGLAEAQRQQREIEREHARSLIESKTETWRRDRKGQGPLGIESGFAEAMRKAAEQERQRGGRGKDKDRDKDPGRER